MHHQHRSIGQFGQRHESVDRFRLGPSGVADRVVPGLRVAGRHDPIRHPADHVMVLGMDHRERPVGSGGGEHVEDLPVVDHEPVIGHVQLERRDPVGDRLGEMLDQGFGRGVGHDEVEGVVDDRLAGGPLVVVGQHVGDGHALVLGGERHGGGGPAKGGRHGGGVEVVGVHHPGRRQLLDVGMAVDPPGQHELAGRVELGGCPVQRRALGAGVLECGDHAIAHADICGERVFGGDHGCVANDEIRGGHRRMLCGGGNPIEPPGRRNDVER